MPRFLRIKRFALWERGKNKSPSTYKTPSVNTSNTINEYYNRRSKLKWVHNFTEDFITIYRCSQCIKTYLRYRHECSLMSNTKPKFCKLQHNWLATLRMLSLQWSPPKLILTKTTETKETWFGRRHTNITGYRNNSIASSRVMESTSFTWNKNVLEHLRIRYYKLTSQIESSYKVTTNKGH